MKTNKYNSESGQMAILVMLVLVVALTIGLTLLFRTTTNLRLSTNTELSQKAYSAAEAGIEEALRGANGGASSLPGLIGTGPNQARFDVSITNQGNTTDPFAFPNALEKDEAGQIWLFDYAPFKTNGTISNAINASADRNITIYWGSGNATANPPRDNTGATPALEATFIYKDAAGFGIDKYAVDPSSSRGNNFDSTGITDPSSLQTTQGSKDFYYKKDFTLTSATTSGKSYLLLRLKLLYNTSKHEVAVRACTNSSCTTAVALPSQGQVIESTGKSALDASGPTDSTGPTNGQIIRKVKVYQSYPTLPSIFDFVVFNGSTNPLEK